MSERARYYLQIACLGGIAACGSAPANSSGQTALNAPTEAPAIDSAPAVSPEPEACLEHWTRPSIPSTVPPQWIADINREGPCAMTSAGVLSPHDDLAVHHETVGAKERSVELSTIGPLGVAHEFEVGVSWDDGRELRGFCMTRSEQGFRYAARYDPKLKADLASLTTTQQDVDGDGTSELVIVEDAFVGPKRGDPAITATAYDWIGNALVLDRESTRRIRSRLAAIYQRAAESEKVNSGRRQYYADATSHLRKPLCLYGGRYDQSKEKSTL